MYLCATIGVFFSESLFSQWKEDDNYFVSTKVCDEVENKIKSHNLVIVSGHSGSGKSAIIQHIALKYREKGWNVKPLSGVQELINTLEQGKMIKKKILLVLNDPFGKEFFDEIVYNSWITHDHVLKSSFETIKLVMSCRASVLSEYRLKRLIKEAGIVQVDIGKNKLTEPEKKQMLDKYKSETNLSESEIDEIVQTEAYFPLLCKLYFRYKENQQHGIKFFREPENVVKEEIRNYKTTNKERYCALVLLVLFDNNLCVDNLTENKQNKQKYKHAQELCGINNLAPCNIGDSLESMNDFFVREIDGTYQFYHDFIMEATTFVFGTDYPKDTIEYGKIGFLRRRVRFKNCDEEKNSFTIYLNDTYIDKLGERLFNEILGVDLLEVVLNPCLKNKGVYEVFERRIEKDPEKLHQFLEKKIIKAEKQKTSQAISKSFLTDITFLSLEEKISPLFALITFCHTEVSLHCLQSLEDKQDVFMNSCLFSAVCCNGSIDLLNIFSKKIDKFLNEKWGSLYPIHIASAFLNHEILRQLLDFKVDANLRTDDEDGCTPLILAAANENEENRRKQKKTIDLLLQNAADINAYSRSRITPVSVACKNGNQSIVKILLKHGSIINYIDKMDGSNPLYTACQEGHTSIIKLLLKYGADINLCDEEGAGLLYIACQKGHDSTVEGLLNNGANKNLCTENGISPLHIACQEGNCSTVQLLLSNGADISVCMKNGKSPLHTASAGDHFEIVEILITQGANIDICQNDGKSPLYTACENGHERIVNLLLRHKAKVDICTKNGESPLYVASTYGYHTIVKDLLTNGANINVCQIDGESPLYAACVNGYQKIVELLLSRGANKNICKKNDQSPLVAAQQNGHDVIVKLLRKN